MRGLKDERGAVAVLVAVSLVAMLGMGAIVVDVAAMFQERRELQNGADAAALAIAENCARRLSSCTTPAATSTAQSYVDQNALDDTSAVDSLALDLSQAKVTVTASTRRPGGATDLVFKFASALSDDVAAGTVRATAVARWGAPAALRVAPFTFEACEFAKATFGVARKLTMHVGGDGASCASSASSSSGQDYPGGFGYLTGDATGCSIETRPGPMRGETGSDPPSNGCTASAFRALVDLGKPMLVPIFNAATGSGTSATYSIVGYGAFVVTEYLFSPGSGPDPWNTSPTVCHDRRGDLEADLVRNAFGSARCIRGYFTEFVAVDAVVGSGPSFGTNTFSLSD